jgi:hypothetical protein
MVKMRLFVVISLCLHIVPFLVTELIVSDHSGKYKKMGILFNLVINSVCFGFVYAFIYKIKNPFSKVSSLFYLQCSYQDLGRLARVFDTTYHL